MNKSMLFTLVVVIALVIGAGAGYQFAQRGAAIAPDVAQDAGARQPLFYRHPMNPEITSPVPAKGSMGMDYIPVYADDSTDDMPAGTVRIDPVTLQNIGVRTARVERQTLSRVINTVGRIDYNEKRLYRLHPKTEGWVEELLVDTTGAKIRKGDILMSIYSPRLVSTQQEYLLALKNLDALQASSYEDVRRGAQELLDTSLERLRFMDVPEHQIEELRDTREVKKQLHMHASASGIVTSVGVRNGQDELPWVKVGDRADMTVRAVPGEVFSGELTYIYPYAESKTRTIKARLEFDNTGLRLKPNMFANVAIQAGARQDVMGVPSEAIVRSGLREKVFIVRAPGKFEPREVITGVSSDGFTEVREGIEVGEQVVVSAQFLIDSESKLREATAKMQAIEPGDEETGHDHPAH